MGATHIFYRFLKRRKVNSFRDPRESIFFVLSFFDNQSFEKK